MGFYGYTGDVNNSISSAAAYPGGRAYGMTPPGATRFGRRTNAMGEVSAINQGTYNPAAPRGGNMAAGDHSGVAGRPIGWWLTIVVLFVLLVWAGKHFAPGEAREFGNIKPGLYNGLFLAFYIVIILSVLKVAASKVHIPGLSDLILAV